MSELMYYIEGGTGDRLDVYENYIIIRHKGFFRFLFKQEMQGDRLIYITNIAAVQLKRAGWTAGHLKFTLANNSNGVLTLLPAGNTILTVTFLNGDHVNDTAEEIKLYIEERINKHNGGQLHNVIRDEDELQRLKKLLDTGLLTQTDFVRRRDELRSSYHDQV